MDKAGADGGDGGKIAHCQTRAQTDSKPQDFRAIFSRMARNAHTINPLHDCPTCKTTGHVASRLPFRQRVCPECGGTGHVSLKRREQLLKKAKERA